MRWDYDPFGGFFESRWRRVLFAAAGVAIVHVFFGIGPALALALFVWLLFTPWLLNG